MEPNTITCGNALDVLKFWPDGCIDMAITSPPYWGLRAYDCPPQIWGGDKNCEHDWSKIYKPPLGGSNPTDRPANVGANRDLNNIDGIRGRGSYSDSCNKCGAWQGHLGLEPTYQLYIDHLLQIFCEVKRVLKPSGNLWINIGDSYSGSGQDWSKKGEMRGTNSIDTRPNDIRVTDKPNTYSVDGVRAKSLVGIPERFMLAMIDDGWILRNKIVWAKQILYQDNTTQGACMPVSVKDRFNQSWEYLYFFTKSEKYYFDLDAVRVSFTESGIKRILSSHDGEGQGPLKQKRYWEITPITGGKDGQQGTKITARLAQKLFATKQSWERKGFKLQEGAPGREPCGLERKGHSGNCDKKGNLLISLDGKCPPTVWAINTVGFPGHHFAVYLEALLERPIKACCPPGGVILDPFMGSGTTALVALSLGRKFVGIDGSQKYVDMARKRIEDKLPLLVGERNA